MQRRFGASGSGCREPQQHGKDKLANKAGRLEETYIENEYEHVDDEDDLEEEKIVGARKKEFSSILKAQEPDTLHKYGDIHITPFNLKEEINDGELDVKGDFIIKKNSRKKANLDDDDDDWAETIDWLAVERLEKEQATKDVHMSEEQEPEEVLDKITCYKRMLRIMRPDETVQKSIRRLGNSIPKRNFKKPKSTIEATTSSQDDIADAKLKFDSLVELAHLRLEDGDINIYQKTYEDLEEAIN